MLTMDIALLRELLDYTPEPEPVSTPSWGTPA